MTANPLCQGVEVRPQQGLHFLQDRRHQCGGDLPSVLWQSNLVRALRKKRHQGRKPSRRSDCQRAAYAASPDRERQSHLHPLSTRKCLADDVLEPGEDMHLRIPDTSIRGVAVAGAQEVCHLTRVQAAPQEVVGHLQVGHFRDLLDGPCQVFVRPLPEIIRISRARRIVDGCPKDRYPTVRRPGHDMDIRVHFGEIGDVRTPRLAFCLVGLQTALL